MKDTKFRILLDIHEVRSQATIPVKVGDVSCKIYITLVEGGKPYKIHENSFGVFTGTKGDNNPILNNCIIENGIIRYDFTPQTVAAAGVLECEVRIYDEDGGVLTTPSFNIVVDERAVNDSELASAPEFAFLDEIIVNEGQRIENERNRNEAFNKLGIDLEDDGEVISIVKTDIDGSQEKASFLKYAGVIPPVTATASGSAITIDSANAPLQNLKLYGKTEQDGTPTPDTPIPLVSTKTEVGVYGDNLWDLNSMISSGIGTYTVSNDTVTFSNFPNDKDYFPFAIWVDVEPNTYYTLRLQSTSIKFAYIYTDMLYGNRLQAINVYNNVGGTFYSGNHKSLLIGVYSASSLRTGTSEVVSNIMLNKGDKALPYQSCTKQTLTPTITELNGIGDIRDEIDFARGVKTQKVGIVDLGTLAWESNGNGGFYTHSLRGLGAGVSSDFEISKTLCTHYQADTKANVLSNKNDKTVSMVDNGFLRLVDKSYTDATSLKTALSGVMLYYPLATPIETPISESELNAYRHLMTNKGTTTILSECEDTEITYYVNKPNAQVIGSLHEQINKDYFKLQQAIISTGGN